MNNRICLLIPWYGKFPDFFEYFLQGCQRNTDILDIKIFTTNTWNSPLPSNVKIHSLDLRDLEALILKQTDYKINLDYIYKICDLKPLYGKIFETYLTHYDFWGYGDLDTVYGDLSNYLTNHKLNKYDAFSFREYIISGGFAIFRNNSLLNNLYSKSKDIDNVFLSPEYLGFDEAGKKMEECRKLIPAYELINIDNFECWTSLVQKEDFNGNIKLLSGEYMKESLRFNAKIIISDEIRVLNDFDRYAIYHLVYDKQNKTFKIPKKITSEKYHIVTSTGFYTPFTYKYLFFLLNSTRNFEQRIINIKKRISDSIKYRLKIK